MSNNLNIFNEEYKKLTDYDIQMFEETTKELIKTGFIVNGIESKYNNYFNFLFKYSKLFYSFFNIMGFEFRDRRDKELYYIKDKDNTYVRNINKNETIILLALRVLYEEQKEMATMESIVTIKYESLNQKLNDINYEHMRKDQAILRYVREGLRLLKNHNIIRYDSKLEDNSIITIYPSIELILDFKAIDEIINRKKMLLGGEVDEVNED